MIKLMLFNICMMNLTH